MSAGTHIEGMQNVEIGRRLEEVADLLEAQRANPFRVQAISPRCGRRSAFAKTPGRNLARAGR
jgi:hypothetical protein